jgi:hypothetical protein
LRGSADSKGSFPGWHAFSRQRGGFLAWGFGRLRLERRSRGEFTPGSFHQRWRLGFHLGLDGPHGFRLRFGHRKTVKTAQFIRDLRFDRTGVSLLVCDAELGQQLEDPIRFYLKLTRQLVDSYLTHFGSNDTLSGNPSNHLRKRTTQLAPSGHQSPEQAAS